jgi:acetyl esterase/lipase
MVRRILAWALIGIALLALVAHFLSPWPSVLVIRAIFDKGAAVASEKLQKHLPQGIVTQEAIRYDVSDPDALLDIYHPAQQSKRTPTIVWVHGGGFVSGRRSDVRAYLTVLAARGFSIVNVGYTTAPTATYPTPVRQVSRALAFVDREGDRLGVNREALIIAGDSAGAQIAAQVANIVSSSTYATAVGIAAPIRSEQLKGAMLYCGVYDLGQIGAVKGGILGWFLQTVTWAYSGKRDWRQVPGFELMSVARHVTPRFPPTFITVGNADPLGPQSVFMDAALRKVGVTVEALFFAPNHPAKLGHEYQFDLDTTDGERTLDQSVAWLAALTR